VASAFADEIARRLPNRGFAALSALSRVVCVASLALFALRRVV